MTQAQLLDYSLIVAYVAIIIDISMQIHRVWKRKSSHEISILGTLVRVLACGVFLTKYITIQDPYLSIGQSIFIVLLSIYFFLLVKFRIASFTNSKLEARS